MREERSGQKISHFPSSVYITELHTLNGPFMSSFFLSVRCWGETRVANTTKCRWFSNTVKRLYMENIYIFFSTRPPNVLRCAPDWGNLLFPFPHFHKKKNYVSLLHAWHLVLPFFTWRTTRSIVNCPQKRSYWFLYWKQCDTLFRHIVMNSYRFVVLVKDIEALTFFLFSHEKKGMRNRKSSIKLWFHSHSGDNSSTKNMLFECYC